MVHSVVTSYTMGHHRIVLQAGISLCFVFLAAQATTTPEFGTKLPLPAARSIRSEGQALNAEPTLKPDYHFRYSVHNGDTGDFKSQEETRDGRGVVGRYTVAEPTGQVREVKYSADEKRGFRADVKMHPPGTFGMRSAEKRSTEVEEKAEEVEKASSDEAKEEQAVDDGKSSDEVHEDKPQHPEELTDEEVEKTLEKQEHILSPQEHQHSHTDEEKSADAGSHEQTDNLIITVNAEKKPPVVDTKAEKRPVHVTNAVSDPVAQPAYPFSPQFYSPYPFGARIPHPAVSDSPAHHAVAEHPQHIPHPAVVDFHLKTAAPVPAPVPVPQPSPYTANAAFLPSFIYQDHPISPVSPLFIQQPSQHAHHYLPGNVQDILAAKQQATVQDVENMVRHATADDGKYNEKQAAGYGFQIHPKPMMFQLADPTVHYLLPSNQVDQSFKSLSYLSPNYSPNYPYGVPYFYQPQDGLGRGGIPQFVFDQRHQLDEAQKSIFTNFDFMKPIVSNIPPQYLPQKFRPVSSTPAPVNADQVSATPKPEAPQQIQVQINKGQTPVPATASSPSQYFNFPFLYPLTTFLQRPFLQQTHQSQPQAQKDQVQQQVQQDADPQKQQKPVAVTPQSVTTPVANDQQRYYVIQPVQPNYPGSGQYRYNPGQVVNTPTPAPVQKAAVKSAPLRQPAPTQAVPVQSHYPQEKSGHYAFPYNSPVALLVLPMDQQPQHNSNERKGVRYHMDNYYRK